jgi:hypothetical protein
MKMYILGHLVLSYSPLDKKKVLSTHIEGFLHKISFHDCWVIMLLLQVNLVPY